MKSHLCLIVSYYMQMLTPRNMWTPTQESRHKCPLPARVYGILFPRHRWGQQRVGGEAGGRPGWIGRRSDFSSGSQICGVAGTQKLPERGSRTAPEGTWMKYQDFITHPSTRHCIRAIKLFFFLFLFFFFLIVRFYTVPCKLAPNNKNDGRLDLSACAGKQKSKLQEAIQQKK